MYNSYRLGTPPPASQFRRPWSPDPYDPLPSNRRVHEPNNDWDYDFDPYTIPSRPRREQSDISVEALDLADYAHKLRQNPEYGDAYPPFPSSSKPSPRNLRPLPSMNSMAPPSLMSDVRTTSSQSHAHSSSSRRPFSLPPPAHHRALSPSPLTHHNQPYVAGTDYPQSDTEIDIGRFPPWSRNWYNHPKNSYQNHQDSGPYPPSSYPDTMQTKYPSPFDPTYQAGHESHINPYLSYPYSPQSAESNRDILPWSSDPLDYGPPLDQEVKEERVRMLEREFGAKGKGRANGSAFVDDSGKPLVGTVDRRGRLVTEGPKKRGTVRFFQFVFALGAAIPSIYVAIFSKPRDPPPPAGKPQAYVLYALSVITFFLLFWLFLIRPFFGGKSKEDPTGGNNTPNGLMVLPVAGTHGKKKGKKGKKGHNEQGSVQVNLIVDPGLLGGNRNNDEQDRDEQDREDELESDAYTTPGTYSGSHSNSGRQNRRPPKARKSIFALLHQESQWKAARSWLKKVLLADIALCAIWAALFIFIMMGKRCVGDEYGSWCTGYNVSTASACLLCVAFGLSIFFDIKDLHASRVSPRTR